MPGATEEEGGSHQLGLLNRGVKRSVYLLVNQLFNPRSFSPSPCPHLAMCHRSAPSFPISSQLSFLFFFMDNRIQPGIVRCVAGASHFHKAQQVSVITLNANVGIKIMWAPSIALCTHCAATKITNKDTMITANK